MVKEMNHKPLDESLSALSCGCDPRENHKCQIHRGDVQCIMKHWIRRPDCPACEVLLNKSEVER